MGNLKQKKSKKLGNTRDKAGKNKKQGPEMSETPCKYNKPPLVNGQSATCWEQIGLLPWLNLYLSLAHEILVYFLPSMTDICDHFKIKPYNFSK